MKVLNIIRSLRKDLTVHIALHLFLITIIMREINLKEQGATNIFIKNQILLVNLMTLQLKKSLNHLW
jgi:hypothetical protein